MQDNDLTFIQQQANDWLVKLETDSMLAGDEDRFVAWLDKDERHGEAFYQAEQTWQLMHQSEKAVESQLDTQTKAANQTASFQPAEKPWFAQHLMPLAATVLLSFSALFWGQDAYVALYSDHYTVTGERTVHKLEDGSVLTLNTDSAIDIHFDQKQRQIEVLQGEVYVSVAPNPDKPFVVVAGNMKVTALGTAFMVRKNGGVKPTVTVTEHSVRVESTESASEVVIQEGQKVSLDEEKDKLTTVEEVNSKVAKAWLNGKYVFQNKPFEVVVTELNRYFDGTMLIRNDQLKNRLITGVLDLDKPVESLENLTRQLRIKTTKVTPYMILIDRG